MSYDHVNPDHYKNGSKEVYEMMIDIWGTDAFIFYAEMCAFKYRMRIGLKPDQPIERDLEKAKWYEEKIKEIRNKANKTKRKACQSCTLVNYLGGCTIQKCKYE